MMNVKNKLKIYFSCKACGFTAQKWLGRCPSCYAWNSFEEKKEQPYAVSKKAQSPSEIKPVSLGSVQSITESRIKIGIEELDNVLGGGLVRGSVVLIGGQPGIGKSTLMIQAAEKLSASGVVFYVSGEESVMQIKSRADRLGIKSAGISLITENNIIDILNSVLDGKADCVIIDSIQTMFHPDFQGSPGSALQIRECAQYLVDFAKKKNIAVFILGHITKEGEIAGPKLLEHLVDAVLYFEAEKQNSLRMLQVYKNRFGPVSEIAIFEMTAFGLKEVKNSSGYFINSGFGNAPGSCAVSVMEGSRVVFLEVQALLSKVNFGFPKRNVSGYDYNRAALIIALLENKLGLPLGGYDVFVNVVGGIKIQETSADLGVLVAIASAFLKLPPGRDKLFIGEIGLTGETRNVGGIKERVSAAAKYEFSKVFVPADSDKSVFGVQNNIEIIKVSNISQLGGIIQGAEEFFK